MSKWIRVKKKDRCQICKSASWCAYTEGVVYCMREPSEFPVAAGGWLHKTDDTWIRPVRDVATPAPQLNADQIWKRWKGQTDYYHLDGFAMSLGVTTESLVAVGCVRGDNVWGFPMRDENRKIIGIRLRNDQGQKWAVTGSRSGLFVPDSKVDETMAITEGPTDTAASLTLGVYAIGRPSCLGCEPMVNAFIKLNRVKRVIVISDNDGPGMRGAEKLQETLRVPSCLFLPPTKDIREFVNLGGDAATFQSLLRDTIWRAAWAEKS